MVISLVQKNLYLLTVKSQSVIPTHLESCKTHLHRCQPWT